VGAGAVVEEPNNPPPVFVVVEAPNPVLPNPVLGAAAAAELDPNNPPVEGAGVGDPNGVVVADPKPAVDAPNPLEAGAAPNPELGAPKGEVLVAAPPPNPPNPPVLLCCCGCCCPNGLLVVLGVGLPKADV
jgi:hypothetical protein